MTEHRQRMALESQAVGYDKFEILAITAGAANGWEFQPEVLRARGRSGKGELFY